MRRYESIAAYMSLVLIAAQVLLVLVSWIVSSLVPELPMRSMLSSEGIRWFFGYFTTNLSSPLLIWIILIAIALGAFSSSGLYDGVSCFFARKRMAFRQKYALWFAFSILILYIGVIMVLALVPHAILLSSTGDLFPSSFSASLIPYLSLAVICMSVVYGVTNDVLHSIVDVFRTVTSGLYHLPPIIIIYILAAQLFYSFIFIISDLTFL